jgi:lysyl-tRNA synthetase class 1
MDATDFKTARAWPFEEARKLLERLEKEPLSDRPVLFQTGYGPSGLPHIGTFGEVARTTMVRHAFRQMSDRPTRLVAFSDDMDGLRKVPDNIPNKEMVGEHLGKPLTQVPDPFGQYPSFGQHNNARLRSFLDHYGFDYEFYSATECYKSGLFDEMILTLLAHFDAVRDIVLPVLGPERRATYSPILPISPRTGHVLQVPVIATNVEAGTLTYREPDGEVVEIPVTGGHCKLQWRADWAMRWAALKVDYEMAGKDLIESFKLSSRVCREIGGTPPAGFHYELFLDEKGEKISKSRGNGLTIEEWLRYATPESLSLYMFQSPRKAKRLYFDVIPKAMDDYLSYLEKYWTETPAEQVENPVWHIHRGNPPQQHVPISFSLLLNLVGAAHSDDPAALWGFIRNYVPGATPEDFPLLDRLVGNAIAYYEDFVKPTRHFRRPEAREETALADLDAALARFAPEADAAAIQTEIYEVGKRHGYANLRDWFKALYEILLGQEQGPRMGSFVKLFGLAETRALIARILKGEDLNDAA